jgi:hypothetical protein
MCARRRCHASLHKINRRENCVGNSAEICRFPGCRDFLLFCTEISGSALCAFKKVFNPTEITPQMRQVYKKSYNNLNIYPGMQP